MLLPKTTVGMRIARHLGLVDDDTVLWASNGSAACIAPYRCVVRRHPVNGLFKVYALDGDGRVVRDSDRGIDIRDVCTDEGECRIMYRRALADRHERLLETLVGIQTALRELDDDLVPCHRDGDPAEIRIAAVEKAFRRDMAPRKTTAARLQESLDGDVEALASAMRLPVEDVAAMVDDDARRYREEGAGR